MQVVDAPVVGEARTAARSMDRRGGAGERPQPGLPRISSGETTVRVSGTGRGGRNQEFALAAGRRSSAGSPGAAALASVGTDGVDGPDRRGRCGGRTPPRSRGRDAAGLSPDGFLANNDAYRFFAALGDLIHTGPTGTNVGDLQVILLA